MHPIDTLDPIVATVPVVLIRPHPGPPPARGLAKRWGWNLVEALDNRHPDIRVEVHPEVRRRDFNMLDVAIIWIDTCLPCHYGIPTAVDRGHRDHERMALPALIDASFEDGWTLAMCWIQRAAHHPPGNLDSTTRVGSGRCTHRVAHLQGPGPATAQRHSALADRSAQNAHTQDRYRALYFEQNRQF